MAIDAKVADGIVREWWDEWFEEDYSWEGLAKKPWRG